GGIPCSSPAEGPRSCDARSAMATAHPAARICAPTTTPPATRTRPDSLAFATIVPFPTGEDGHRCVSGPTDPSSHRHGVHGLQNNGQVQEQAPAGDVVHVEVDLVLPIEFVPTADLRQHVDAGPHFVSPGLAVGV